MMRWLLDIARWLFIGITLKPKEFCKIHSWSQEAQPGLSGTFYMICKDCKMLAGHDNTEKL